jgi:hypothetical protein
VSVFVSFTSTFALQLRKKHGKPSIRVRKTSVRLRKTSFQVQLTYYQKHPHITKPSQTHTLQIPPKHTHYKTLPNTHITKPSQTHTLQNPPKHTHYKTHPNTHITKPSQTHTLQNPLINTVVYFLKRLKSFRLKESPVATSGWKNRLSQLHGL